MLREDSELRNGAETLDGCAGPGGWDEAARQLGLDPLGIEIDDAACATRRARGHRTLQADLTSLDPGEFAPVRRMIFSPPCPSFSMAGKGEGRSAIPLYQAAMVRMAFEDKPVDRAELDEMCGDPRAHLILEPLRWALALRPVWVACEQVEPCLPLWETMASCLRHVGYMTWTGVLSAEQYGVPQTRRRAFLLASLSRQPERPAPSHQRYIPPRKSRERRELEEMHDSLFEVAEPERIVAPEDRELLPWVSMAEALGWNGVRSVCNYGASDAVLDAGATIGHRPTTHFDPERRPSRAVTHSIPDWRLDDRVGFPRRMRANAQPNAAVRSADEPAPTITGGHDTGDRVWEPGAPTYMNTGRDWKPGGSREDAQKIPTSEPSPTVSAKLGGQAHWVSERPATTVAGDPRVFPPGHKVRVSIEEAAVLQGFPADYPWQGSRTAIYRQIGDAVPPPLARAVLAELER